MAKPGPIYEPMSSPGDSPWIGKPSARYSGRRTARRLTARAKSASIRIRAWVHGASRTSQLSISESTMKVAVDRKYRSTRTSTPNKRNGHRRKPDHFKAYFIHCRETTARRQREIEANALTSREVLQGPRRRPPETDSLAVQGVFCELVSGRSLLRGKIQGIFLS